MYYDDMDATEAVLPIIVYIDGEREVVTDVFGLESNSCNGEYLTIILDDGCEYVIFESDEDAGIAAKDYWENMVEYDPREFTCIIGEETLVKWALGQSASPGTALVSSLDEWLDLWLNVPQEHWASYDGSECEIHSKHPALNKFTVAYRHN